MAEHIERACVLCLCVFGCELWIVYVLIRLRLCLQCVLVRLCAFVLVRVSYILLFHMLCESFRR